MDCKKINLLLADLFTYALINITWVFFRAKTFTTAWQVLGGMFGAYGSAAPILSTMHLITVGAIICSIVFAHWRLRSRCLEDAVDQAQPLTLSLVIGTMMFAIVIAQGEGNAFIYFQF